MARLDDKINNDGSISAGLEKAKQQALNIQSALNDPNRDRGGTDAGSATSGSDNAFMSALQERLLGQGGIISSTDTDLEAEINRAVESVGAGREASEQSIKSRFGEAISGAQETGLQNITNQRESSGGFATQMARLRQITDQTDERIGELERQREQAILNNNAQAANKISDLIIQEQQMQTEARQNAISNLFSGAQLQQSQQQFAAGQRQEQQMFAAEQQLAQQQMDLTEANAVNEIRMEFPEANIPEGASVEEAAAIARPFAEEDKEQQQNLEDIEMQIKQMKAQTDRITANKYAAQGSGSDLDSDEQLRVDNLAEQYMNGEISYDELLEEDNPTAVLNRVDEMAFNNMTLDVQDNLQAGQLTQQNASQFKSFLVSEYPEVNQQVINNTVDKVLNRNSINQGLNNPLGLPSQNFQGSDNTANSTTAFFETVYSN